MHPTFKLGSNTQQANVLLIESFLKEGLNPWFHPSLIDLTDNSNVQGDFWAQSVKILVFSSLSSYML